MELIKLKARLKEASCALEEIQPEWAPRMKEALHWVNNMSHSLRWFSSIRCESLKELDALHLFVRTKWRRHVGRCLRDVKDILKDSMSLEDFKPTSVRLTRLIMEQGLRLQVIGRRDRLPENVLQQMDRTISMSEKNPGTRLVLAIDYGGRDEITQAVRKIADKVQSGEINISAINENTVNDHLYTSALPEVDLLIRTGGDLRVSNFLLWQLSYAEFWMTEKCWPEFTKEDFVSAMIEFSTRQRRFGGLNVNE